VAVQCKDLVAVGGLENAEQRFRVKTVGHDEQFR